MIGLPGMIKAVTKANTTVAIPSIMNSQRQDGHLLFLKAAAIPAANSPPKAPLNCRIHQRLF
jgi:hypothetical protein